MSLEYIFKFIMLLVVISVVTALIIQFKGDIVPDLCSLTGSCGNDQSQGCQTKIKKENDFTSAEVAKWIKSCWSQNKGGMEDCACYSLQGNFSATKTGINQSIRTEAKDHLEINVDFSQTQVANVFYDLEKDKILVK